MPERTVDPVYVPGQVTTPVGTQIAAPITTTLPTVPGQLVSVHLTIPRGHAGLTGWRLLLAQQQIIPYSAASTWVLGDGHDYVFDTDIEVGPNLQVVTYNIGNFPHTHYMRFKIARLAQPVAKTPLRIVPITAKASGQ